MSDVFISHVEEDTEIALQIALGLEEAGYTTWCYEVDNIPGPSYLIQTGQAVEQAKALVLVISPHSLGSRQVTKEVIRAHETDKEFIPVLQDITHIEFQNRQPEWREALGAASSIRIPMGGVADIIPRIISGLKASGILPGTKPKASHIAQIRKTLVESQRHRVLEKTKEPPITATRPKLEAVAAEIQPVKTAEGAGWRKKWVRLALIAFAVVTASVVGIILLNQSEPAEPEVQPPPSTGLPYEDDFSNPDSGFTKESNEKYYQGGEYYFLVKKNDWSSWVWNRRTGQLADFALEIDARLVSGPNDSKYGVIFRCKDSENFYRFLVTGGGSYYVGTRTNDKWTYLQRTTESGFIKEGHSTNHLKVVCQGSQIEVYVNGHHLTTVTDNSFAEGYVGMIVYNPQGDSSVAFDNLRVYRPTPTPTPTPSPTPEPTPTPTPTPAQEGTKQINIIYVEGNNPVSGKEIWLSYYDEDTLTWISEKGLTDKEGVATFSVPEGDSGESFTFTLAFSEAEVEERAQEIGTGKRLGWRIPPNPLQTSLTLEIDNDFNVSVVDGRVQMWVP